MNALCELRLRLGVNQREMANLVGSTRSNVSMTELSLRSMPGSAMKKLRVLEKGASYDGENTRASVDPPLVYNPVLSDKITKKKFYLESLEIKYEAQVVKWTKAINLMHYYTLIGADEMEEDKKFEHDRRKAIEKYQKVAQKYQKMHIEIKTLKFEIEESMIFINSNVRPC